MDTQAISCPYCQRRLFGYYYFEVKCYFCHKYFYLYNDQEDLLQSVYTLVSDIAMDYISEEARSYLKKTSLSQSGPVILNWFHREVERSETDMKTFLRENLNSTQLAQLYEAYPGIPSLPHYLLDQLNYPVEPKPLQLDSDSGTFDY